MGHKNMLEKIMGGNPRREQTLEEGEAIVDPRQKIESMKMDKYVLEMDIRFKEEERDELVEKIDRELIPNIKETYVRKFDELEDEIRDYENKINVLEEAISSLEAGEKIEFPDDKILAN